MKVVNRSRWTRTKMVVALIMGVTGIGFIGGLEGEGPIPHTWPLGILCALLATSIIWTCRQEDF